ncbi:hypothetical protein [Flagellimonas lutimaris]|uniref:hypothetical protein n=1 Tax=Flagellimonas lutimaris TaxID=475082 RepID=UPI003F5CBF94
MDTTNPFTQILHEIKTLSNKVEELGNKIPKEQSIKRYSPQDIADNTPLTVSTVWTAIRDDRIKAQKFGRKYIITQEEFDRVCEEAKSIKYKRG